MTLLFAGSFTICRQKGTINQMKYKYFLFDWDGSLGNTLPLWFETFKKVFKEYGVELSYYDIGKNVIGVVNAPLQYGISDLDAFYARVDGLIIKKLEEVDLNEGAKKMLEEIKKRGGKMAVVTTSRKRWVKGAYRKNGLRELVDVFLGKEDVVKHKPDPEILYSALRRMNGSVKEAIMIGDTANDVWAAKNAGMDSALYYPDEYEQYYDKESQKFLGATYTIKSFEELSKLVVEE